jgi:hypothetical protein
MDIVITIKNKTLHISECKIHDQYELELLIKTLEGCKENVPKWVPKGYLR